MCGGQILQIVMFTPIVSSNKSQAVDNLVVVVAVILSSLGHVGAPLWQTHWDLKTGWSWLCQSSQQCEPEPSDASWVFLEWGHQNQHRTAIVGLEMIFQIIFETASVKLRDVVRFMQGPDVATNGHTENTQDASVPQSSKLCCCFPLGLVCKVHQLNEVSPHQSRFLRLVAGATIFLGSQKRPVTDKCRPSKTPPRQKVRIMHLHGQSLQTIILKGHYRVPES